MVIHKHFVDDSTISLSTLSVVLLILASCNVSQKVQKPDPTFLLNAGVKSAQQTKLIFSLSSNCNAHLFLPSHTGKDFV